MDFKGKLALITGGSSGIGLATAKKLAAQGSNVWIFARDPEKLDAACQDISAARLDPGQKVGAISVDITQKDKVDAAAKELLQRAGIPDLLINSAGFVQPGLFAEQDLEIYRKTMDLNYFGAIYVTRAFLPAMIQRGSGHIVNISSEAGIIGLYGYSSYGPTKFAIRALSDSMRYELDEHGIRVSVVFPPDTQTPQLEYEQPFKPPLLVELEKGNKVLTADQVAEAIIKGVAKNHYIITPGSESPLYFGLTNFFGLIYPVMNVLLAQARRSLNNRNGNGAAKNNGRH